MGEEPEGREEREDRRDQSPEKERRRPLPALVVIWEWRIHFLRTLFAIEIPDPSCNYKNRPKSTIRFGEYLKRELLPVWREANRNAKENTIGKVSRVGTGQSLDLFGEAVELRIWYAGWIDDWRQEAGYFRFPTESLEDLSIQTTFQHCWDRTAALLRIWNLDGYKTAAGKTADVRWIREVICSTLDIWTNANGRSDECCIYVPYRIAAAIKSSRNMPGAEFAEADPMMMDLLGFENTDTFPNLSNVLDFYHLDKKVIIAVPECYDFTPNKNWKMNVIDIATRALNEHLNCRRRIALGRGVIMRPSKKRSPHHLNVFVSSQLLGMSYLECVKESLTGSATPTKKAIESVAELIGLPVRARKPSGRPKK